MVMVYTDALEKTPVSVTENEQGAGYVCTSLGHAQHGLAAFMKRGVESIET